jgi:hypothetical protein
LFFVLGECGVEGAWGFSGVFHTTLFSCFVRWRGHRVTSRNSGLRFLLPMTHCNFPAPMGGSHLCRFGRPGFPTGGCLDAFDVDATREGSLSLSISAIALASLSLSVVVLPMSSLGSGSLFELTELWTWGDFLRVHRPDGGDLRPLSACPLSTDSLRHRWRLPLKVTATDLRPLSARPLSADSLSPRGRFVSSFSIPLSWDGPCSIFVLVLGGFDLFDSC